MKYIISLGKENITLEVPCEFAPDEIQDVASLVNKLIKGHKAETFAKEN